MSRQKKKSLRLGFAINAVLLTMTIVVAGAFWYKAALGLWNENMWYTRFWLLFLPFHSMYLIIRFGFSSARVRDKEGRKSVVRRVEGVEEEESV